MKKIYAVLIAIVLLSGYIVTAVSADINSECDQVKITEKVVLGENIIECMNKCDIVIVLKNNYMPEKSILNIQVLSRKMKKAADFYV